MPSVSAKQAKLMSAIAHGWKPPMKDAPSMAIAQDFHSADKKQGKFMHADGGKVGALVNFAKAGKDALLSRLEGAFDNPYTANTDQVRADISKYWRTAPPPVQAPAAAVPQRVDTSELDALAAKHYPERLGQFGDFLGGRVQQRMADNANKVAQLGHKYGVGDVVQGQKEPWRITGLTSTKHSPGDVGQGFMRSPERAARPDLPAYHVESLDGDTKTTMAEWGIQHKFDGPRAIPGDDLQMAEGGAVDTPTPTDGYLGLIRHAADRASAAISDDPHHALARVAAGLASQVATLSPSGHAELGSRPGIVNETLALPAGLTDMGIGAAQVGGALHDKLGSQPGVGGLTMQALGHVRDELGRLQGKYGDLAPKWSRDAEAKTGQLHSAVHKAMGLGDPHGLAENLAEAGGTMLGQIPIGASKEGLTGLKALGKLFKSPLEWLGPTIRPSPANYAAGTLFGGLAGTAGGNDAQAAPSPYEADATSTPMKEQFQ